MSLRQAVGLQVQPQTIREGLLLPKRYIQGMGQIEIIRLPHYIIVKPRSLTRRMSGFVRPSAEVTTLHEDYEDSCLGE